MKLLSANPSTTKKEKRKKENNALKIISILSHD
jgi:hypothetical protein